MIGFLLLSQVSPVEPVENGPQMVILRGQRRRGRPPSSEPGSRVTTWIPSSRHDELIRLANEKEMSVSAYVSSIIVRAVGSSR